MTFYARDNYYFNNINDALSSDSRPINTTTYGYSSSNNFEPVQGKIYDAYGNVDCSSSSRPQAYGDTNAVPLEPLSSTTTTSTAGDVIGSSSSYVPLTAYHMQNSGLYSSNSTNTNDNITLYNQTEPPPDAMVDYGGYNATLDDYPAVANNIYWDNNSACNASESGRYTSMSGYDGSSYHQTGASSSSKMLPNLSHIRHSSSMLDGMYTGINNKSGQRIGACLPTTPPPGSYMMAENSKCRMLPQAVTNYQNVQRSSTDAAAYQKLNGHAGYATDFSGVCVRDVGNGKSLPAVPLRMLAQTQMRSRSSLQQRQLFEDTKIATTTSSGGDLFINQYNTTYTTYDNSTINNYYSSPLIAPRAHSSMLPIDYTDYTNDDDDDDGYNNYNADNLSTYSDTTPLATTQQKLQQQRKLSLMMAMTTASVIASGETRIPLQLATKKKAEKLQQQQDQLITATAAATQHSICSSSKNDHKPLNVESYMFEYISSGNKSTLNGTTKSSPMTLTTTDVATSSSVVVAITTATAATNLKSECYTNTTTTSTTATINEEATNRLSYETHSTVTSTSRKLPKRLPTPQYKAPLNGTTTEKPYTNTNINNSPTTNNGRMTKQLPKLPIQQQHQNQAKPAKNTLPASNLHSPISTSSCSITNTSASASTFAYTSVNSPTTLTNLKKTPPSLHRVWNDEGAASTHTTTITKDVPIKTTTTDDGHNNSAKSLLSYEQESYIAFNTRSSIDDILDSSRSSSSSRNSNSNINNNNNNNNVKVPTSFSPPSSSSSPLMKVAQTASASDHIYNKNLTSFETTTIKTTPTPLLTLAVCTTSTTAPTTNTTSSTNIELSEPFDIAEYLKPYSLPALSYDCISLDDNSKLSSVSTFLSSTNTAALHGGSGNVGKFLDNQIDNVDNGLQMATESTSTTLPLLSTYSSGTRFSTLTTTTAPSAVSPTTVISNAAINSETTTVDFSTSFMSKDLDIGCLTTNLSFPHDKVTTAESTKEGTLSFITTAPANAKSEISTTASSTDMLPAFNSSFTMDYSISRNAYDIAGDKNDDSAATLETKSLTMQSYADYMKKFELPELPSLTTISDFEETTAAVTPPPVEVVATTVNTSLPSYLMDFMSSDFTLPTLSDVTEEHDQTTYKKDIIANSSSSSETQKAVDHSTATHLNGASNTTVTTAKIGETSATAFDDSFYDSFNVDLSAFTAPADVPIAAVTEASWHAGVEIVNNSTYSSSNFNDSDDYTLPTMPTSSFATPIAATEERYVSTYEESISGKQQPTFVNTQGGYYKPSLTSSMQTAIKEPLSSTTTPQEPPPTSTQTQQKYAASAAATAAAAAAGKATTSMFGGLSKGLKDGLDGVLSSSGQQQQQPNQTKKSGFGFNLASKLVPNVSGLLSTKTQAPTTTTNNVAIINTTSATLNATATASTTAAATNYNAPTYTVGNAVGVLTTPHTSESVVTYVSGTHANPNVYGQGGDYSEMMLYSDNMTTGMMDGYEDEYGYSEYPVYHTSGNDNGSDMVFVYSNDQLSAVTEASDAIGIESNLGLGMTYQVTISTTCSDFAPPSIVPANKSDSSILSTQAKVTNVHSTAMPAAAVTTTATTTTTKKSTATGGGSGMFGSFLGKAAAAVQTATQVVNQGASMASSVVQKVPIPSTGGGPTSLLITSTTPTPINAISEPNALVTTTTTTSISHNQHPANYTMSTMSTIGYDLAMNNDFNSQLLNNQDSLSSQYSTAGDDYENSNMLTYTTAAPMIMTTSPTTTAYMPNTDNKIYTNYYSNGNQSQLLHSQSSLEQEQQQEQTVPPAGSSGKKLPTINGKSGGYLMKQQPTEIFDDEDEFIDDIDHDGHIPNYCIDSEQNDYYMDQQQTTPSIRNTTAANGYYEHTNGSYDYREDYFNEEDEYKYLEKEEQQKMEQHEMLLQQQQHQQQYNEQQSTHPQQQLLKQQQKSMHTHSTKLSSLEYIDDDLREDSSYIDDNYQSEEDSGNYLDESSGGSVGGGAIGFKRNNTTAIASNKTHLLDDETVAPIPTATVDPTIVRNSVSSSIQPNLSSHLQIKKQDSIIMEEDEEDGDDDEELTLNVSNGDILLSPGRKSSILDDDEEDEDDTLPDLNEAATATRTKAQKKKVLMRGETEEVVSGHMMHMLRKPEITAKQRWHWAYNKIIMQLNVSKLKSFYT